MPMKSYQMRVDGDDTGRDEIIEEFVPLVKIIAYRLAIRLPSYIDIDDLIDVGVKGLLESIDRFDRSRGVRIDTYLSFRIKGAMLDELRRMDWVPRGVRQKAKRLEEEYCKIESQLGRSPTDKEMADRLGINEDEYARFLQDASGIAMLSIEDLGMGKDVGRGGIIECLADPKAEDPVSELRLKELREYLGESIDKLPEREKTVLSLYYYEDLNLKEIGDVMGVSESRICQIHSQAILRLKGRLKKIGADGL